MHRRQFLMCATPVALATPWILSQASQQGFPKINYARATVIDALGAVGEFDPLNPEETLISTRALADAKESGITALNYTIGSVEEGPGKFEEAVRSIAEFDEYLARHPETIVKVQTASDIAAAKSSGRLGIIYGVQNTTMLEGDLKRLALFHGLGVRIVQPVYNLRNLMGDGCLEAANGGLTALGRALVAEIDRLKILLDLSHAGPRTAQEAILASKAPVAITHTGCRALVDVPRNVSDETLKLVADKGGVIGIYFVPFLRAHGQPHAEDVIRHLEHALNVCGEDHIGIGTDGLVSGVKLDAAYATYQRNYYEHRVKARIAAPGEAADIYNLIPEYNDPRRFLTLANDLAHRGWPTRRIEKVLGENFARLFRDVWDGSTIQR